MKKVYSTPSTEIVEVKIENLMLDASVENLGGPASDDMEGMSRGDSDWDD